MSSKPIRSSTIATLALAAVFLLQVQPGFAGSGKTAGEGDLSGIAERELARRQAMVEQGRIKMAEGDRLMDEKDYEQAREAYRTAYLNLPDSFATAEERQIALEKFADASVKLAEQRIAEGRFDEAKTLIEEVVSVDYYPGYKPAVRLLARLEDPEWFNRAVTPSHIANVSQVDTWLREGQGYYDIGDFDLAMKRYDQVLNVDPYNSAAQRGKEMVQKQVYTYGEDAYNAARAQRLSEVQQAWEIPPRPFLDGPLIPESTAVGPGESLTALNQRKLNEIIIPKVSFADTTIREALEFLKQESVRRDTSAAPGQPKGVNIVLDAAAGLPAPAEGTEGGAADPGALAGTPITVDLSNVPLRVALEYVTRLAGLKFKVEPYAVLVVPQSSSIETLITKEYRVRADFLSIPTDGGTGGGSALPPNLGGSGGAGGTGPSGPNARAVLEAQGVNFPPGSSAIYFPSTSRLVVKNIQTNIELIDQIVESQESNKPKQITVESKFVEINQNDLKELSFDWLLGGFDIDSNARTFAGGGTAGTTQATGGRRFSDATVGPSDYTFTDPATGSAAGGSITTAALRSGRGATNAIALNAIDTLISNTAAGISPGTFAIAGILTDPNFQVVIRALDQKKGVDLLTAPRVTTKSGSAALVEIIREFRYPIEFDPPQLPEGNATSNLATPTTPTAFEMRPVGVTLNVLPTVGSDNYTIELELEPIVTEFEGFINYGSPINDPHNPGSTITDNTINQPIFSTRRVKTAVTIWDGQTVVLGGLMREDVQKVDDKIPVLGDIPLLGRAFRSKVEEHIKKNLVIFVTATLIDPAGQNLRLNRTEERIMTDGVTPETTIDTLPLPTSTGAPTEGGEAPMP